MSRSPSGSRSSGPWARFRRQLLDARGWRCEECGSAGCSPLELHHVVPVAMDPSRRFDPTNVLCLGRACHLKAHRPAEGPEQAAWRDLLATLAAETC